MAFVPGYEHDIFISYAHVDNTMLPGEKNGWIMQFYNYLKVILSQRFGRPDCVSIWWDEKKLDGTVQFDQSIEHGIKKSAIMICLNSPGYIASKYCKLELETFYQKAQTEKIGLNVADRSRIVHVQLNNIPYKEWPKELSGTTGFPFHTAKETDEYGDPLETGSPEFKAQIQKLKDAIWHLLTDFAKQENIVEIANTITESGLENLKNDFSIYLGEVADTLRIHKKRIITELEKKGFTIVAGAPPPDEAVAHEKAAKDAIQKADLAVHLLDAYPGREILGDAEICYPQKQTELALQTDKPQMIWLPDDLDFADIEDEEYKGFITNLGTSNIKPKGLDVIRSSKSDFAKEIINTAEKLKAEKFRTNNKDGKLSVLLDTHAKDEMYAWELSTALFKNQIFSFINPQEDDPRKNIELLSERISRVNKLIFLYGAVSKEWVIERMSAALQLIIDKDYPIDGFYVYMAPPKKSTNDISIRQRILKVNVIDSSNNQVLDETVFKRFLDNLKSNAA